MKPVQFLYQKKNKREGKEDEGKFPPKPVCQKRKTQEKDIPGASDERDDEKDVHIPKRIVLHLLVNGEQNKD
ncbi:MAG: hypothetical protein IPH16_14870 [Haliscomenobacter sp.]|nr:hypothetical protein [Haliscomenobacter sp.]